MLVGVPLSGGFLGGWPSSGHCLNWFGNTLLQLKKTPWMYRPHETYSLIPSIPVVILSSINPIRPRAFGRGRGGGYIFTQRALFPKRFCCRRRAGWLAVAVGRPPLGLPPVGVRRRPFVERSGGEGKKNSPFAPSLALSLSPFPSLSPRVHCTLTA